MALARVTLADLLVLAVVVLGGLLRFANLGGPLLTPPEAQAALPVWAYWQSGPAPLDTGSPAYFALSVLLSPIAGSSDTTARLVPAIFGTALLALPWLLRGRWKAAGVLFATLFMAVSPMLVVTSRTAGGEAIALFTLLLVFVSALRLSAAPANGRWATALGVGLGIGLTSDPIFYMGLLPLAVVWWWFAGMGDVGEDANDLWPFKRLLSHWRPIGLAALLSLLALSTLLLLNPTALGATFRLPADWLGRFGLPAAGSLDSAASLLATLRYEPALFVLGLPVLVWAMLRRPPIGLMLGFWLVTVLLLVFLQPGVVTNAALLALIGYLLIGLFAGRLLRPRPEAGDSRLAIGVAGGLLLLGLAALVSLGRYARVPVGAPEQLPYLVLAGMLVLAAIVLVGLASAVDPRRALQGAFVGLALLLIFIQWGAATSLAQYGSNDPRERWVSEGTDDDVRLLASTIRLVSRQAIGGERDLDLFSTVDTPVLRWYLRDFPDARFGATVPLNTSYSAVITPLDSEPRLPNDYAGDDFGLLRLEPEVAPPSSIADILRWWLFRESGAPAAEQRIVLWIRADLTESGRQP
jgi:hypothetical protein